MRYRITLLALHWSESCPNANIRMDWCEQNFGRHGNKWVLERRGVNSIYGFVDEADAVMFALRWADNTVKYENC